MTELEEKAARFKNLLYELRKVGAQSEIAEIMSHGELSADLRERCSAILKTHYKPIQRLRTHHKTTIKVILSLDQGYDGDIGECFHCHQVGELLKVFDLHHTTYNVHDNRISVLALAHRVCNVQHFNTKRSMSSVVQDSVNVRDRLAAAHTGANAEKRTSEGMGEHISTSAEAQEWTSTEGERHDKLRAAFDEWILDLRKGPFMVRIESPQYRSSWGLARLARFAVHNCTDFGRKGSSVTFARYIKEDGEGGPLVVYHNGVWTVKLKEEVYKAQCLKQGLPYKDPVMSTE